MKRWMLLQTVLAAAGLVWGCATGISEQSRSQVTFHGAFDQLLRDPRAYVGETLLLGGKIIETQVERHGSDIVVLQLQLDASSYPVDNDRSGGRFIIRTDRFLDPALYAQGVLITVVGKLLGDETRPVGELQYNYPVMDLIEIRSWPAEIQSVTPRFHIGIGFGTTF